MAVIELGDMEFHAFHGCFKEERIVGNRFLVNCVFETDTKVAETTDNIADTVNYQKVYQVIKSEMAQTSHLLEHVARRIKDRLLKEFPSIKSINIKVTKTNPAMGGMIKGVSVTV